MQSACRPELVDSWSAVSATLLTLALDGLKTSGLDHTARSARIPWCCTQRVEIYGRRLQNKQDRELTASIGHPIQQDCCLNEGRERGE